MQSMFSSHYDRQIYYLLQCHYNKLMIFNEFRQKQLRINFMAKVDRMLTNQKIGKHVKCLT